MMHPRRTYATVGLAASSLLVLAGCSSTDASETDASTDSSASTETTEPTAVSFALDWTPNTNHTGLYVALAEGYFEDAGLDVEVLPYNSSSPDTLVDAGTADFGISFESSMLFSKSAGAGIVSVMSVLQHTSTAIGVRADNDDIQSPADLDGLTYGGFGAVDEEPTMQAIIQGAGGTGEFESVVLGTSAYEALYSGDVDFTVPFVAWEGIEAELRGEPMKYFYATDYGFPDQYNVIVIGNESWIEENPDAAAAFVQALQEGYEYAAANPDEAAQILMDENPDVLTEEELVTLSQEMLSADYLLDDSGAVGTQTEEMWADLGSFYYDAGLLADADGNVLTEEPDWTSFYTTDLID
ncbi:ABC transporter substrate-binding protein [Demequina sp. NBRC 110054]|uniref:ABC transporter substrate-binding protein n=1 Tax=Demequina sp. NBRC 110054 TaxID=1570343 RepID=UPI001F369FF6|nr:ABC transporter substrate-binding protein [Demequina sp. NBRC 110054]